jgi:DNA replicative helicase MCM subunit Mcm2 (Cdc46/Mcm family)
MSFTELSRSLILCCGDQFEAVSKAACKSIELDISIFIDTSPEWGIQLYSSPYSTLDKIQACMYSILDCMIPDKDLVFEIDLKLINPPSIHSLRLSEAIHHVGRLVQIQHATVKSMTEPKTCISFSIMRCRECHREFKNFSDLLCNNQLQPPSTCQAFSTSDPRNAVPSSFSLSRNRIIEDYIEQECLSNSFENVENPYVYKDYQEITIKDGQIELVCVLRGSLVGTLSVGEPLSITGIFEKRWMREIAHGEVCELQHVLIATSASKMNRVVTKVGLREFLLSMADKKEFEVRSVMLRSFMPEVYGNYHVKLGLILCVMSHMMGHSTSCLILGESGSGKSTILRKFCKLEQENTLLLNGGLTNKSCLSNSYITNTQTGGTEVGLLESPRILCIDDFHLLTPKPILYKAIEAKSVITAVTTPPFNDFQIKKRRKDEFPSEVFKIKQVMPEVDKFDIILKVANYSDDIDFIRRMLEGGNMQDYDGLWESSTIKHYIQLVVSKSHKEILIKDAEVQKRVEDFISYLKSYHLKISEGYATSVSIRTLESVIKLSRAHAALFHHATISLEDVNTVILLYLLSYRQDLGRAPSMFIDFNLYYEELSRFERYLKDETC